MSGGCAGPYRAGPAEREERGLDVVLGGRGGRGFAFAGLGGGGLLRRGVATEPEQRAAFLGWGGGGFAFAPLGVGIDLGSQAV